jgi:hypothetical protein
MRALRLVVAACASLLMAAALATPARATATSSSWASVRTATAPYHDLAAADAAGWNVLFQDVDGLTCIIDTSTPSLGGMGYHYVNPANIGSTDPLAPAALVYAPTRDGGIRLAALEYLVVIPQQATAPTVNGVPMMWIDPGNRFLGPTGFYALHVWLWDHNPGQAGSDMPGLYDSWNPKVTCCC